MKKSIVLAVIAILISATSLSTSFAAKSNSGTGKGSGNGSGTNRGAQDGALCSATGPKNARTSAGVELECQKGSDGKYAWHPAMGGSSGGQGGAAPKSLSDVWGKDKCSGTSTKITHGITDPSNISYIVPMGAMLTSHITPIDHIYIYMIYIEIFRQKMCVIDIKSTLIFDMNKY